MPKMFLLFNKKYFFIIIFLLPLLVSCAFQKSVNKFEDFSDNEVNNQSINLKNLRINLYNADKKLINAVKNVDLVKDNPTYNPYYTNQSINRMLHKEKDFSDLITSLDKRAFKNF